MLVWLYARSPALAIVFEHAAQQMIERQFAQTMHRQHAEQHALVEMIRTTDVR